MKNLHTRVTLLLVALGCTLLVIVAYWFGFFTTLQNQLTDRLLTPDTPDPNIIIVDIDEPTLAALGQWPFARSIHATTLINLEGADLVGFDVLFVEPSLLGVSDDEALVSAITAFRGEVVLAQVIDEQSGLVVDPIPQLAEVASLGFVNTKSERDGVVRSVEVTRGELRSFDSVVAGVSDVPNVITPIFNGPAQTYTTVSYVDVYEGRIPKEVLDSKTVLIGASAAGLGDTYQTPFGAMPGVEIHANTIESLTQGMWLSNLSSLLSVFWLLLIGLLIWYLVTQVRQVLYLYGGLGLVFLSIVAIAFVAIDSLLLVPHLYAIILFALVSGSVLVVQYVFENKEKQFIRRGFEQYVASEVVEELYHNPDKLTLGGETRELSILFSDIRSFTTISEQLTPQQLMEQLNEYLEEMSEAVMQHKGLVDKYIGDAVMAFWGAPLANPKHPVNACESVLAMYQALQQLNKRWEHTGKPAFQIGVGVSTGEVVVGNMGSKRRFNYSIIGDEVNFSARIEGLTKQYGVFCLIGETTYQAIKDSAHLYTRELDDVMVKGKVEPRRIYELLPEAPNAGKQTALQKFALGRSAYVAGDFSEAVTQFTAALVADPTDGPSQVFKERSEMLQKNPPTNWNGVFEFTTK